jgi:iron(III) transport system ATP-binding protein
MTPGCLDGTPAWGQTSAAGQEQGKAGVRDWIKSSWDVVTGQGPAHDAGDSPLSPLRARAAAAFSASLTFDKVSCRFGEAAALDGVSLTIAPGEVVCLLGPSGSGKTTLLRVASGIERPTGGRVLINDREVASDTVFVPPEQRNVGLMFQDFALFPHLSIADNVAFGLQGLPKATARAEAMSLLARVDMTRYADAFPHTLSGGEQQRVALARALVPRPSVILMDEPFSGLDVQLREQLQDETLKLLQETRATAMIVTHSPDEALRLGDRIAVMRAGRIVQVGKAEELYHNPADLFIARLFSEINEIPFDVMGASVRTPIGAFSVPDIPDGERAILCIRRRAIRIANTGETGIAGRVLRSRFLGDLAALEIGLVGFEQPMTMLVLEANAMRRGSDIKVVIDPGSVLIFPAPGRPA